MLPRIGGFNSLIRKRALRVLPEWFRMNDVTLDVLRASLRGLSARQHASADNIANLDTPGYLAKRIDFEATLSNALGTGHSQDAVPTERRSLDPTGLNGNNVNLDDETIMASDTGLRYQLSVEALNAKYRLLRVAIRGQG